MKRNAHEEMTAATRPLWRLFLYGLLVWTGTFLLMAFPVRIYDFDENKYAWFLRHLFWDAIQADEELIILVGLTAWSTLWALFFSALHLPRQSRPALRLLWGGALAALALTMLGTGMIRHAFHGIGAYVFHAVYSVLMAIGCVWIVRKFLAHLPGPPQIR